MGFLCELASLHAALREDDLAIQLFWRARTHADALPAGHPDAAVVWCGLGRVAFHAGCQDLAARCLSKARRIREKSIGGDTIETATTYNNLACCLSYLGRVMEAVAHLELALEILRTLAGEMHPRTQVAVRNLAKVKSCPKNVVCEIPHLFTFPIYDEKIEYKYRKKKGKKKGSRGRSRSSRN